MTGRSTEDVPHPTLPGTIQSVQAELEAQGVEALAVQADLLDAAATARLAEAVLAWRGRCDVLVNNAAFTSNGPVLAIPFGRWEKGFRVQVGAPLQLVQALVPGMLERGRGRVLSISTGAATTVQAGLGLYSLTKVGTERLIAQLDLELARPGITFNVLRIEIGVETETYRFVVAAQGTDFVSGGGKVTDFGSPAAIGAQVAWLVGQPDDWSGHVVECKHVAGLGGPDWR